MNIYSAIMIIYFCINYLEKSIWRNKQWHFLGFREVSRGVETTESSNNVTLAPGRGRSPGSAPLDTSKVGAKHGAHCHGCF